MVLRLHKPKTDRKVKWEEGVVDNELMGKKKSKCELPYCTPHAHTSRISYPSAHTYPLHITHTHTPHTHTPLTRTHLAHTPHTHTHLTRTHPSHAHTPHTHTHPTRTHLLDLIPLGTHTHTHTNTHTHTDVYIPYTPHPHTRPQVAVFTISHISLVSLILRVILTKTTVVTSTGSLGGEFLSNTALGHVTKLETLSYQHSILCVC